MPLGSTGYTPIRGIKRLSLPRAVSGAGGFGWDPIFQPLSSEKTFAEMMPEEKDRVSMRRQALERLRAALLL
jgi:inosine/xanthosine triphosphate pyrophosphatase family protein